MRLVEVFQSIDGEAIFAGRLTNFVRIAHCNLRCTYCDTPYALTMKDGEEATIQDILSKLDKKIPYVTLTGGEPLLHQVEAAALLKALVKEGYQVSVETNGSIDLQPFIQEFPSVVFIMDWKSITSGMSKYMEPKNLAFIRPTDVIKFVVGSKSDMVDMESVIHSMLRDEKDLPSIFVSPIFGKIEPVEIVEFLLERKLNPVRMQLQMHKFIWNPEKRGV